MQIGETEAEEGWSQEHARDHFTDDLRLAEAPGQRADEAANGENGEHLQKEGDGELGTGHDVRAE